MRNCSNDFPTTDVLFEEFSGDAVAFVFLAIGCVLAVISTLLYVEIVFYMKRVGYTRYGSHFAHRCTLVGLYPVICVMSVISLIVPTSTTLIDFIISCYISWCIHTFVQMTLGYYGGESEMIETLFEEKVKLSTPPCCCCCWCCLKPITLSKKSLRVLKLFAMQVAVIRPFVLFIAAVLWTDGKYVQKMEADSSYVYITAISGVSTILSVYGMIVIFRASRQHLHENCYTVKFAVLQMAVIIANLQSAIFTFLADRDIPGCNGSRGPRVRAANINHAILVIEAFLMCLLARYGYRREETHLQRLAECDIKAMAISAKESDKLRQQNAAKNGVYTNGALTPDSII